MAHRPEVRKAVELYDPHGRPVDDPALAARAVTTYYDEEGRVVKRVWGRAVIMRPGPGEDEDGGSS